MSDYVLVLWYLVILLLFVRALTTSLALKLSREFGFYGFAAELNGFT